MAMTLILLSLAWLAGVLLADFLQPSASLLGAWTLAALVVAFACGRERGARRIALCLLVAALGGWRLHLAQPRIDAHHLAFYNDHGAVAVEGYVSAEPSVRGIYTQIEIRATGVAVSDSPFATDHLAMQPVRGALVARVLSYPPPRYGDLIRVTGRLETPPVLEGFDYREFLAARGVHSVMRPSRVVFLGDRQGSPLLRMMLDAKDTLRQRLEALLPYPEVGLLLGIVLGLGHTLPAELYDAYRATGLAHIIVISGFNISILSQLLLMAGHMGLRRWLLLGLNVALIALYTLFVGPSPPVTRAAFMAALVIAAQFVGRKAHAMTTLAAVAWIMTLIDPLLLKSVSFQLSMAATLGMLVCAPLLRRMLEDRWVARSSANAGGTPAPLAALLREVAVLLSATVAAQIGTLPIVWAHFGTLSLLALPANLLVLPLHPTIMVLGLATTLLAGLGLPLAQVFAWITWPLLRYTNGVVELLARVPWATVDVPPPGLVVLAILYGGVAALVVVRKHREGIGGALKRLAMLRLSLKKSGSETRAPVGGLLYGKSGSETRAPQMRSSRGRGSLTRVMFGLAIVVVLVWSAAFTTPDGRLRIYVLDVGQGDAILVRTPGGRHILVDGGPDPLLLSARLGRILPFWQRRLDMVVATHGDMDHIGGLIPLLGRYPTGHVLGPPGIERGALGQVWHQAAIDSGANVLSASQGMAITLGDELHLQVIHPQAAQAMLPGADPNRHSVVMRLAMGHFAALLTGDIDAHAEQEILARGEVGYATVLKVAHHGSATSTSAAWLDAIRPQIAVISVGAGNAHGHPNEQVLERLEAAGCRVYRTDKDGTIEIITDGEHVWIRTHKGRYHDRSYRRQSYEPYADRHPAVAGQRYARGVALL